MHIFIHRFATSLGYYGLVYSAGSMPGGVFLNTFVAALVQFPANTISVWLVFRFGRRKTQIWCLLLAGIFLMAAIPFVVYPGIYINEYRIL